MEQNNKFFISKEAQERFNQFLLFSRQTPVIHNVNNYWLTRQGLLKFYLYDDGVEVEGDTNLHARIRQPVEDYRRSSKVRLLRVILLPVLTILFKAVRKILRWVEDKIEEDRLKAFYQMIFDNKQKYFPFGYWELNGGSLRQDLLLKIVKSYPFRAIHMLRAMDVINHFRPLSHDNPLTVLEIGSGPAILAGIMSHTLSSRHILVDLPEQAMVGFLFLSEFFPKLKILLPNEVQGKNLLSESADIIFITPEQLNLLPAAFFDIGINMFSFQEMSAQTVEEYYQLLRRCLKKDGVFYCMNRARKSNPHDKTISEFDRYPWVAADRFLHRENLSEFCGDVRVCGGPMKEALVCLAKE